MKLTTDTVFADAMRLGPKSRVRLLEKLREAIDPDTDWELDPDQIAEIEARYEAYKSGRIKALDGSTFFTMLPKGK